jgi:hypothetical protein
MSTVAKLTAATYLKEEGKPGKLMATYDFGYLAATTTLFVAGDLGRDGFIFTEEALKDLADQMCDTIIAEAEQIAANPEPAEAVKDVAETCTHDHPAEVYNGRKPPENRAHRRRVQKKLARDRQYYASGFEG